MANAYAPTYSSLLGEVQDICENTNAEFVANIPLFIARGADQVQRDLGLAIWRTYVESTLSSGSLTRDTAWLIVRSLWLPTLKRFLDKRDVDYVRMYGGIGRPKVWAEDTDTRILVAPTPGAVYPVTIDTYQRLPVLSASNETNWLTQNVGDLLLLQTLINACSYLVSPERVQEFNGLYQAVLPGTVNELRELERQRYSPVRAAPRPVMQAGASA